MYRILISPLNGDRAYYLPGLRFSTDMEASLVAQDKRRIMPDAKVEVIYVSKRTRRSK